MQSRILLSYNSEINNILDIRCLKTEKDSLGNNRLSFVGSETIPLRAFSFFGEDN